MEYMKIDEMPEAATKGTTSILRVFFEEVLAGLTAAGKYLPSKYFYDRTGDDLFQQISVCEEYYLSACEMEIFRDQTAQLAARLTAPRTPFDLIELGAGDCRKSVHLLRHLHEQRTEFVFLPIDISANIIGFLQSRLTRELPGMAIHGFTGENLAMLARATALSSRRKVILFLGSTLGNLTLAESKRFCQSLRSQLKPGDLVLMGLDLKKSPSAILAAYNDKGGITKRFNLNLLHRINRELKADFDVRNFEHFPTYDPRTGACKSFLISLTDQQVTLRYNDRRETILFSKEEEIYMEVSQKYTPGQIDDLAKQSAFETLQTFHDRRNWFTDVLWKAV